MVKKTENIPITAADEVAHVEHIGEKQLMREVKKQDKKSQSEEVCIVVFHHENVITLPKADVGCFFYKRKLTLYNLTAHTVKNKDTVQSGTKPCLDELGMTLQAPL